VNAEPKKSVTEHNGLVAGDRRKTRVKLATVAVVENMIMRLNLIYEGSFLAETQQIVK